ncbi:MAG: hypothetical protein HFI63_06715 [Lachnospiraceae bacterium]|nr:hypothetical protein [Lachnospiraceae bacterium]
MLNSLSGMNSYYSMYRYGFSYGTSPTRGVQKQALQNMEQPAASQVEKTDSKMVLTNTASHSRPAAFFGGRLYLTAPASEAQKAEGASASGLMSMGTSPEEMAVQMRIQYLEEPSSAPSGSLAASENSGKLPELSGEAEGVSGSENAEKIGEGEKCQTCEERKYQDGSDDMGVSFKTPTRVAPEDAASAVRGHEQEHVVREQAKAEREGRRVVSQSVSLHTGICPECGEVYISGGTTKTVTASDSKQPSDELGLEGGGQTQAQGSAARSFFAVA